MTENPLPNEVQAQEKKPSKFPRWLLFVVSVLLIGVCCVVLAVVIKPLFNVNVKSGGYSIESVTLSSDLEDNQPVDVKDVFNPSEAIICTVKTAGIEDGIIGMRWYLGENKIYEYTGKTKNNTISTYIESNKSAVLPEGKYRVEIFVAKETLETAYFEVKIYHPTVNPPILIPEGHTNIEIPWYPEAPFAFDEVWNIDNTEWKINEVKVVLMDDTQEYFVAVVVNTDMKDLMSISKDEAKARTRAIALYAIEHGYVEAARGLEIDGKHYDLDQSFFVILKNPSNQQVYRIKFTMDELQ
ncbi:MAG: hypothetical protein HY865_18760 [Chloroflexi bacterium]|nr:hypothetical protein [Chloroflexota bacterium]